MEALKDRPPYVTFEIRAVEDRTASLEKGQYVSRDEIFAIITPAGSKDRTERVASEWFDNLKEQVSQDRFPVEWLRAYKATFAEWKEGREPVVKGTDVRNWPVLSPSQVQTLLNLKVRTVEDLAVANEETLGRLGMGGRSLKQRAIDWLASASGPGKISAQMEALREELEACKVREKSLEAQVAELTKQLASAAKPTKL